MVCDGEGVLSPESGGLDIIGVTYRDDTPEGEAPVMRDGYLVNVRLVGALPAELEGFLISTPEFPKRVWAGTQV